MRPRRWLLLLVGLPLYTVLMAWVASLVVQLIGRPPGEWDSMWHELTSPGEWLDALDELYWWIYCGVPALVLVASQCLFLYPVCAVGPKRSPCGRSLRISIIMAALVAGVLTVGLAFALAGLLELLEGWFWKPGDYRFEFESEYVVLWIFLGLLAASWLGWSIVMLLFCRRRNDARMLGRVLGLLLGGTLVEVIVVLPLDIMVRRKTDCYCATGSFHTLCLSAWALLWLAGPGAIIAVLSKRRRLWWDTHCANCGYEKGPSPGERCPECGHQWRVGAKPQAADG